MTIRVLVIVIFVIVDSICCRHQVSLGVIKLSAKLLLVLLPTPILRCERVYRLICLHRVDGLDCVQCLDRLDGLYRAEPLLRRPLRRYVKRQVVRHLGVLLGGVGRRIRAHVHRRRLLRDLFKPVGDALEHFSFPRRRVVAIGAPLDHQGMEPSDGCFIAAFLAVNCLIYYFLQVLEPMHIVLFVLMRSHRNL